MVNNLAPCRRAQPATFTSVRSAVYKPVGITPFKPLNLSGKSGKSYKRECQEKHLPFGLVPILFCLGIQPNWVERALPLREWSFSGLRSCFVSVAEERFLFAVVPYPCCDGAIRFLKHPAGRSSIR